MGPLKHYRGGSPVRHKELVKSFMRWGIKADAPLLWLPQQTGTTEQQQVSPIGRSDFLVSQVSVSDDGQIAALHGHVNAQVEPKPQYTPVVDALSLSQTFEEWDPHKRQNLEIARGARKLRRFTLHGFAVRHVSIAVGHSRQRRGC